MNFNSMIAGFLGGMICSTVIFLLGKTVLVKNYLHSEKIKDLSLYGRQAHKK